MWSFLEKESAKIHKKDLSVFYFLFTVLVERVKKPVAPQHCTPAFRAGAMLFLETV